MKRAFAILAAIAVLALFGAECQAKGGPMQIRSWLCFYGDAFPSQDIPAYDLYVFQSVGHPELAPLKEKGGRAVGYISAGEINRSDPQFQKIKGLGILLDENRDWPGSFRVDMRSDKWHAYIIDEIVPAVLSQGFDGIFIDTIDVAQYLEQTKKKEGSIGQAVLLISEIRKKYPSILIVLNNGLFLVDEAGDKIDALVVEDVFTLYDFKKRQYQLAKPQWVEERVASLKRFQEKFHKPVLSLDYLRPTDKKMIDTVSAAAKAQGFVPYLSDIGLQKIFFHP